MGSILVDIEPKQELRFHGSFREPTKATITLTNLVDQRVCFKIKTTAPKQYCVRPTSGELEPKAGCTIHVLLQPIDYDTHESHKHKFLVQAIALTGTDQNGDHETIWRKTPTEGIQETKLRCVLEPESELVAAPKQIVLESGRPHRRLDDEELFQQLKQLREENCTLKKENIALREASLRQRVASTPAVVTATKADLAPARPQMECEPFADASIKSIAVMSIILMAVGFLIAKTLF